MLRHYRNINLPATLGLTLLMLVIDYGLITFASAFLPRFYDVFIAFRPTINAAWEIPFFLLSIVIFTPFTEELLFRGVVLEAYRDARSTLFAVLFTSALFGFMHGSPLHTAAFFPATVIVALVVLKSGQLWTAIAAHALYNLTVTLLMFDVFVLPATATAGIVGLVVAVSAFLMGLSWIGLPASTVNDEKAEKKSIWTPRLVIVVGIAALFNLLTTYIALGPGVESIL